MDSARNCAERVLRIVNLAFSKSGEIATTQVWAEVFGLNSERAIQDPHEVWEKLRLLRIEIDFVRTLMAKTTFPDDIYTPYLDRLTAVVSVPNISSQWKGYKGNIQPDTILALRYCSEIIQPEGLISTGELQNLLDLILQLREEIKDTPFSPGTQDFLLGQLAIIEGGIRDYPLSGAAAIAKAFHEGFRTPSNPAEDVKDKQGYSKVMSAWGGLWKLSKDVVHMDNVIKLMGTCVERGTPLLTWSVTPLN